MICYTETSLAVKILLHAILSFSPQSSDKQRRLCGCKRDWNPEIGVWVPKLSYNTSYQIPSFHEWELMSYCFKSIVLHLVCVLHQLACRGWCTLWKQISLLWQRQECASWVQFGVYCWYYFLFPHVYVALNQLFSVSTLHNTIFPSSRHLYCYE